MDEKKTSSILKKLKKETVTPEVASFKIKNKILLVLLIVIVAAVGIYFVYNNQKTKKLMNNPSVKAAQELEKIIAKINKFMELPAGETPSMYTVADKSKLPNQSFYEKAENGDKVLIYLEAKKAILYRPSINKIIEVGPVTQAKTDQTAIFSDGVQVTPSPIGNNKIKLVIYDGSKISGLLDLTEKEIKKNYPEVEIIKKTEANRQYQENIVVDLKGDQNDLSQKLARFISGKVALLPENEATPEADILVILGK